jgi:hypothetical protein
MANGSDAGTGLVLQLRPILAVTLSGSLVGRVVWCQLSNRLVFQSARGVDSYADKAGKRCPEWCTLAMASYLLSCHSTVPVECTHVVLVAGLVVMSIALTPDLTDWGMLVGPLGILMSPWLAG